MDHICAREMVASQYRLMPQQRPDTSSFRSGFDSLILIQRSKMSGMLDSLPLSGTDMDVKDCVSGFVL